MARLCRLVLRLWAMHRSVVEVWRVFSEPFEGRVHWLYADVKQLLTAGVGNLADPVALAQQMPWRVDGELASKDEIARQWRAVKEHAEYLSKRHYKFAAIYTTMRLNDDDIDRFVARRLAMTEVSMRRYFPTWDAFPADAQLACLSMAWAVGDGFPKIFKNLTRAANVGDWKGAAASCKIKEAGNPGVVPRNKANLACFHNAARVAELKLDRSTLFWPGEAAPAQGGGSPPAPQIDAIDRAKATAFFADFAREATSGVVEDGLRELAGLGHALDDLLRYGPDDDSDASDDPPDTERA